MLQTLLKTPDWESARKWIYATKVENINLTEMKLHFSESFFVFFSLRWRQKTIPVIHSLHLFELESGQMKPTCNLLCFVDKVIMVTKNYKKKSNRETTNLLWSQLQQSKLNLTWTCVFQIINFSVRVFVITLHVSMSHTQCIPALLKV